MENLWSPWRMKYISDSGNTGGECVFCTFPKMPDGPANLVVHRGENAFAILNRYPYTTGHLMVVPFLHVPSIEDLTPATRFEMIEMVNKAIGILRAVYQPEGFNIGVNLGSAGGAGIAEHAHIHVVPRWAGDTNFMSTTGEIRVLPEDLGMTFKRISEYWSGN
jgi:ATP adenylyltransferase